jgi:TP901 family phage tail tape measure protein
MSNELKLRVLFDMVDGMTRPLRNVLEGNRGAAKALKETRDKLKELGKTQQDVGAFREMHAGLRATSNELAGAQQRVRTLAAELSRSGAPTKAMTREFEAAKRAAAELTATQERQQNQLRELRTRLAGAGVDTRNLAQHERALRGDIEATTAAMQRQQARLAEVAARERRVAEARGRMERTQATAGRLAGSGAGAMAAGAVTGAALKVPVSEYAKAEDSATQLKVALMRAGAVVPPEFAKINDLAMKLGDKLPGTTSDFQDMMTMLSRQGIGAQTILGGMGEATAYLGVQLKKAPAEAAEFAAKLQDATRTTEKDMMGLMDVIQKTFYLGVDDSNMLQGFAKLSPAMDTLKIKGLEGAKALAPLLVMADQAGMAGESAGNAYRKIFQMSMDKAKIDKANKQLGPGNKLEFTDGKGEFGGFDRMFKQFDKLSGLTTQKRLGVLKEIFGDDAETLQVVSLLIEKGAAGYAEVQGKMSAQASLQERVNTQLGTLKNLWEAATGTFTNGMVAFGESISPELKATTEWLGDMAQGMGAWARENPRLAGGLMKTAAVIAVLLTVGGALMLMVASILGPMAVLKFSMTTLGMQGGLMANVFKVLLGPMRLVGSAILFIGRAMLMNPIGLAITAIAAAAYLIYQYWGPIKEFFGGIWDRIKAAFDGGIGGITALIVNWSPMGLFYQGFAVLLSWFGVTLPAQFSTFGANMLDGLVNGITSRMGAVKDAIVGAGEAAVGWFKEKLGIHSPSRVFGELGGFISEGAAGGIDGGKALVAKASLALAVTAAGAFNSPALAQAGQLGANLAQGMAQVNVPEALRAIVPAAAAGGSSGQAGSPLVSNQVPIDRRGSLLAPQGGQGGGNAPPAAAPSYSIQITAAPGMDPQAIARAVTAELDRRERAKQSRIGSRLSD